MQGCVVVEGWVCFDCVLVFYCCVVNYHKFSNLRQHIFYYLTVPLSQAIWHGLTCLSVQGLCYYGVSWCGRHVKFRVLFPAYVVIG